MASSSTRTQDQLHLALMRGNANVEYQVRKHFIYLFDKPLYRKLFSITTNDQTCTKEAPFLLLGAHRISYESPLGSTRPGSFVPHPWRGADGLAFGLTNLI